MTPATPDPEPLRIERTFAASVEQVFDAWTSVDVLRRWWPAGPDWETTEAEVDVRVGGRLRLVMRAPDGTTYGGEGRYTDLRRPERIGFTWRWDGPADGPGQRVDVSLTANADATTTVVLVNSGIPDDDLHDHRTGWQLSFDNLDLVLGDAREGGAR